MRTALKFSILGKTLADIKTQAAYRVAEFLELDDISGLDDAAEVEIAVVQTEDTYPLFGATVSVRIR
jgi:hypothetical protein